jgi:hypothetical protein
MSHDSFSISFALTVLAVLFPKLSIVGSPKVPLTHPQGLYFVLKKNVHIPESEKCMSE